ncbi:MAG: primosomal protein N' (replication factor Y) - superfamily II helicase, partial [Sulfurovum sp.]|nr:primosomal protein N' (replication factor Y) - superfamily II helicase [Sulfurovum sp.]
MHFTPIHFTCDSCGAPLKFSPATGKLSCEFCNSSADIRPTDTIIQEYDLRSALTELEKNKPREISKEVSCSNCGNTFSLTPYSLSTNCPYCSTPAITGFINHITPESIIPFIITHKKAKQIFSKWIGSLWFAPNELKSMINKQKKLTGYYLPYWTYDASTTTAYRGQRGDIYYVTVTRRQIINGKERFIEVQEPRIRWSPASGKVERYFDDVTIEASLTLSRKILSALGIWDT